MQPLNILLDGVDQLSLVLLDSTTDLVKGQWVKFH